MIKKLLPNHNSILLTVDLAFLFYTAVIMPRLKCNVSLKIMCVSPHCGKITRSDNLSIVNHTRKLFPGRLKLFILQVIKEHNSAKCDLIKTAHMVNVFCARDEFPVTHCLIHTCNVHTVN